MLSSIVSIAIKSLAELINMMELPNLVHVEKVNVARMILDD